LMFNKMQMHVEPKMDSLWLQQEKEVEPENRDISLPKKKPERSCKEMSDQQMLTLSDMLRVWGKGTLNERNDWLDEEGLVTRPQSSRWEKTLKEIKYHNLVAELEKWVSQDQDPPQSQCFFLILTNSIVFKNSQITTKRRGAWAFRRTIWGFGWSF
jgi:hypothetical protein